MRGARSAPRRGAPTTLLPLLGLLALVGVLLPAPARAALAEALPSGSARTATAPAHGSGLDRRGPEPRAQRDGRALRTSAGGRRDALVTGTAPRVRQHPVAADGQGPGAQDRAHAHAHDHADDLPAAAVLGSGPPVPPALLRAPAPRPDDGAAPSHGPPAPAAPRAPPTGPPPVPPAPTA
ncbi:hypothetical protein [Vallicoccus soli]|uniref:Uncharacterized protein n=1 Tax=Vallicoccus soli TaxID=2339232 RepID=A0A3A3ZJR5_9ACTN|nr:hypothetical protein [Vallicoccus soli]RJK95973.1 hypothetical protein D5H78_10335 [Vallicoccus soli]